MKAALLYASWIDFGEQWSTPKGFHDSMLDRGWEIQHYNLYHNNGQIRQYTNQGLNQLHQDIGHGYKPDIIMNFDYGVFDAPYLDKQTYRHAIWILEAGDEPQAFRRNWQKASKFDIVLTPDYYCNEVYRLNHINSYWWTHHSDFKIFHPYPEIPEVFDCVTTCGSRGQGLTEEIERVLGARFNNSRYYYGKAHAERLCMGKIVFQKSQFGEITRRIFEGMSCGKIVLTDRLESHTHIEDLFINEQDIVYYDNTKDAIDKIKYYSEHDDERQRIALNGYNKVLSSHTVASRIDQLEQYIEEFKCDKLNKTS